MERKLASIQKITNIRPIPDAQNIEVASVLGWECIVTKKDNFKINDLVIYIEVDSILPIKPEFEFLRDRKFRIRTIKLRKTTSQGLIVPLSILPKGKYDEGQDVTEVIGVKKYDPQAEQERELLEEANKNCVHKFFMRYAWYRKMAVKPKKGKFPSFIRKTDEDRIQLFPYLPESQKDTVFTVTEKLDGCVHYLTPIQTDRGVLPIGKIVNQKLNVKILSYNENSNQVEFKDILDYHKYDSDKKMYRISCGSRGKGNKPKYIVCTDNHEFFTNEGWKRADKLNLDNDIFHLSDNIPFELEQIILGCLLGDASITHISNEGYKSIEFGHSVVQEDYFNFKKNLFGDLFSQQKDAISGFGSVMKKGLLKTNLSILSLIDNNCIRNNKKTVTQTWCDKLSPISLAFWYMDDGNLGNSDSDLQKPRAMFNTQGFSYEEHEILKKTLLDKFNITCTIGDKDVYKGHVLLLNTESTEVLSALIFPYVPTCMKYKICSSFRHYDCVFENKSLSIIKGILKTKILKIEEDFKPQDYANYVYDLTIQDNHNYFANNILIHNSSATYFLRKRKTKWFWQKSVEFGVCSRNLQLENPDKSSYWTIAKQYNIQDVLEILIKDEDFIVLQGEIIGNGIQKNKYKIEGYDFFAFNLIYPSKQIDSVEAKEILAFQGIKHVPILDTNFKLLPTIAENVDYAKAKSQFNTTKREGVVIRNNEKGLSYKIINPEFLLDNDE